MSDTSARASRFAFWLGSFARNGLIGTFEGVGVAASGRGPRDAGSAAAAGRGTGGGADTDWLGAGAEGRAGDPKGTSATLAGLPGAGDAGCRVASGSGRLGGLAGVGAGGCAPMVADAGATLVVATGGALRGSIPEP